MGLITDVNAHREKALNNFARLIDPDYTNTDRLAEARQLSWDYSFKVAQDAYLRGDEYDFLFSSHDSPRGCSRGSQNHLKYFATIAKKPRDIRIHGFCNFTGNNQDISFGINASVDTCMTHY